MSALPSKADHATLLHALIRGVSLSRMIGVACRLGLPDRVEPPEGRLVADLAADIPANPDALRRLCRTLASLGIFFIDREDRLRHSPMSVLLRKDEAPSLHWAANFWTLPSVWTTVEQLEHTIRTGEAAFPKATGQPFFEYLRDKPEDGHIFDQYMAVGYAGRQAAIADALELGGHETVVDVGGGTGMLLFSLLEKHSGLSGILFDRHTVVGPTNDVCRARGLASRCEIREGSFFDVVPSGGDTYLLSWILHDWPDDGAARILRNCRHAMRPGMRLIIIERLIEEDPAQCDPYDLVVDMHMLMLFSGRERTRREFDALLAATGFAPIEPTRRSPVFSVLETHAI